MNDEYREQQNVVTFEKRYKGRWQPSTVAGDTPGPHYKRRAHYTKNKNPEIQTNLFAFMYYIYL